MWLAVSASRWRVQTPSPSASPWAASRSRAGSSARGSPRTARPWTASSRVASSGSSMRAASASRNSGSSASASVPSANVAQSRTSSSASPESAIRAWRTSSPGRPPSANATASRTSASGSVDAGEQPVDAVWVAEVAERAGDRGQHLRVLLVLGERAQRGLLLGRVRRLAVAQLAEDERGELAVRRRRFGAEHDHRLEHVAGPARGERADVRLPLLGRVDPFLAGVDDELVEFAARQRGIEAEVGQALVGTAAQPVGGGHRARSRAGGSRSARARRRCSPAAGGRRRS